MLFRFLVVLALLVAGSGPASSHMWADRLPDWPINVAVEDEVEGGCWSHPQDAKVAMELVLRQSSIPVSDERSGLTMLFSAIGSADPHGYCHVSYKTTVYSFEQDLLLFGRAMIVVWSSGGIFYNHTKNASQDWLSSVAERSAKAFANDYLKLRSAR